MKKTLLLATTAMLLSTAAMNTNAQTAPSNTAQLSIMAMFFKPMVLHEEQPLSFGVILADDAGKKVVVKTDGTLDQEQTTATMLSYSTNSSGYAIHAGIIRAEGFLNDYWGEDARSDFETMFSIDTGADVTLTAAEGVSDAGKECATVTDLDTTVTFDNDDVLIHVGGTLETKNLKDIKTGVTCYGSATLTILVADEEVSPTE